MGKKRRGLRRRNGWTIFKYARPPPSNLCVATNISKSFGSLLRYIIGGFVDHNNKSKKSGQCFFASEGKKMKMFGQNAAGSCGVCKHASRSRPS